MKKSNLDLLLVNPSHTNVYQDSQEELRYPALEPPYLAALTAEFIRKRGFSVEILDANALGLNESQAAEEVEKRNPLLTQVVVHGNQPSASSQLMQWVIDFGRNVKLDSFTRILLTGTHPSALPSMTLEERAFDFVARGEGFSTPLGLLESGLKQEEFQKIHGLWYKEGEKILRGLPEKLMSSDELSREFPKAAWDLLPIEKYRAHDWHGLGEESRQPYAAIYTSFGCPFDCHFCCINAPFDEDGDIKHGIRFRNSKDVADEIEFLVGEHSMKNLKIIDEMFVLNRKHYLGLANELIERGLGDQLNIWAYARVDTIKEQSLDILKRAGFNWLALGIESGSDHVRNGVEKGGRFGFEEIERNVRRVQSKGINVVGNFIFGLPDDNEQTMQETLDFALELNCERPNFYSAMAYPGSALHRLARNTSWILKEGGMGAYEDFYESHPESILPIPKDWDYQRPILPEESWGPGWVGYSQHAYQTWPLPTGHIHPRVVLDFRDNSLETAFNDKGYKKMLGRKFGEKTTEVFCEINSQKPKRMIYSFD